MDRPLETLVESQTETLNWIPAQSTGFLPDFDQITIRLINKVQQFTKTTPERMYGLIKAVEYVVQSNIPGDIVECGVWKGGSIMIILDTLLRLRETNRDIYLFDTFTGMTEPTERDISYQGECASEMMRQETEGKDALGSVWCYATLDLVKQLILSMGYDASKIHFVQGKVEETIPAHAPEHISLLRLDTDWYESTHHELIHLYPRLVNRGVIIIDDYGHWLGARKATEEYFKEQNIHILLNRMDYSGRVGVKCE